MDADLILIHGFWSSPKTWTGLATALGADADLQGIRIHRFGYETPKFRWPLSRVRIPDYNDIARSLPSYIAAKAPGNAPIVLITHSQGGLILQRFLAWMLTEGRGQDLARIRMAVMFACPNEGSDYLRLLRSTARFARHPQASQLEVLNREVGDARRIVLRQVVNAAKRDSHNWPIAMYAFAGRSDNVVTLQSAQSAFPVAESLPGNHSSIIDPSKPGNITVPTLKRLLNSVVGTDAPTGGADIAGSGERIGFLYSLPPDTPDFAGRSHELRTIRQHLAGGIETHAPIVAIYGKPGVGKSSLAVHAGYKLAARFPAGQLYVNLRGQDGNPVAAVEALAALLIAVGMKRDEVAPPEQRSAQFRSVTQGQRLLLLLDNAKDEAQVRPLLPSSPTCGVLITSRGVLAALDAVEHINLEVVATEEALDLLSTMSGRRLLGSDRTDAEAIAGLCGNLPLALRIAGAMLRKRTHWSIQRLADELRDEQTRISRLQVGDLGVAASFSLSMTDLTAQQIDFFAALSLLPYQWFSQRAAATLLEGSQSDMEQVLEALVGAQLLEVRSPGVYQFHDLIRLYAMQQANPESPLVRQVTSGSALAAQLEADYLAAVSSAHGGKEARSLELGWDANRLYVEQDLELADESGAIERLSWAQLLKRHTHVAVLGGPGSGKTALGRRIAEEVASAAFSTASGARIPILLAAREWHGGGFIEFAKAHLRTFFQLEAGRGLDVLLHSGRAVVILDGLDEITDINRRRVCVGELERFAQNCPAATLVVTSRQVGYSQAAPHAATFRVAHLVPWRQAQVAEFATRWFTADELGDTEARSAAFVLAVRQFGDAASSPLILAQLAVVFQNVGRIPRNVADVYEQVILGAWSRWDRQRGLEAHANEWWVGELAEDVALHVVDAAENELIREAVLLDLAETKVHQRIDQADARQIARAFIEFIRGRSAILVSRGTDKDGHEVYGFASAGLLDYLVARALTRRLEMQELAARLLALSRRRPDSQTMEFAVVLADQRYRGGADSLVDALLTQAERTNEKCILDRLIRSSAEAELSPFMRQRLGKLR